MCICVYVYVHTRIFDTRILCTCVYVCVRVYLYTYARVVYEVAHIGIWKECANLTAELRCVCKADSRIIRTYNHAALHYSKLYCALALGYIH